MSYIPRCSGISTQPCTVDYPRVSSGILKFLPFDIGGQERDLSSEWWTLPVEMGTPFLARPPSRRLFNLTMGLPRAHQKLRSSVRTKLLISMLSKPFISLPRTCKVTVLSSSILTLSFIMIALGQLSLSMSKGLSDPSDLFDAAVAATWDQHDEAADHVHPGIPPGPAGPAACPAGVAEAVPHDLRGGHVLRSEDDGGCRGDLPTERPRDEGQQALGSLAGIWKSCSPPNTSSTFILGICKSLAEDSATDPPGKNNAGSFGLEVERVIDAETHVESEPWLRGPLIYRAQLEERGENEKMLGILGTLAAHRVVVLVKSERRASALAMVLEKCSFPSIALRSRASQEDQLSRHPREPDIRIIVCTNLVDSGVAAEKINAIINYDLPAVLDYYLHCVGGWESISIIGLVFFFFFGYRQRCRRSGYNPAPASGQLLRFGL
ncbi:unnamed protein product [Prorocentrum cordatum]|uniref:Helicase C-terminal domain-containing protein n=1 Tax=Prorocentrum cordatum TaxID=2364126 RepID=A0ABN9RXG2_9DINO|nr:unnamed protein product [Polarella glacialis]CAK0826280.1 unnamed protein product [Polarella glacialis]